MVLNESLDISGFDKAYSLFGVSSVWKIYLPDLFVKQDIRNVRTLELEAILESQGGAIIEFSDALYTAIIEKILVKERTSLEFHII